MLHRDAIARRYAAHPTENTREEYQQLKRMVKSRMRRASRNYGQTVMASGDSSKTWELIREATFSSTKGERVSMELSTLNEAFAKIVTTNSDLDLATRPTCDAERSLQFIPLQRNEVWKMLNQAKVKTATGPDNIPASLVKTLAPAIAGHLTTIMNRSLELGVFPSEWKRANIAGV